MTKRKVSPTSVYNVRNDIDRDAGLLTHEGEPWSNEMLDALLEGFLVEKWAYDSVRDCFKSRCKRSIKSIESQLWKLAQRYDRPSVRFYEPISRTDRTGLGLAVRDRCLLDGALSRAGRENLAYKPEYLAKLLGRSQMDVVKVVRGLYQSAPVLGKAKITLDCVSEYIAKIAHETVKGDFKRLWSPAALR